MCKIVSKRLFSLFGVLSFVFLLAACAGKEAVSHYDMYQRNADNKEAGSFKGPLHIVSVKTPDDEKFQHFQSALEQSLEEYHIAISTEKQNAYLLDVEMTRHERVQDDYLEDIYEADIIYQIQKPDDGGVFFEKEIASRFSSDESLFDVASVKKRASNELGDIVGKAVMAGFLAAAGINLYGNPSSQPGTDAIRNAEEDAIGRVIQANFRTFIEEILEQK